MSVRVGDRSEGTLSVLNDIRILGEYTIQICKSEKVFPKSSRWILAKPIVDECVSALACVEPMLYSYKRKWTTITVEISKYKPTAI